MRCDVRSRVCCATARGLEEEGVAPWSTSLWTDQTSMQLLQSRVLKLTLMLQRLSLFITCASCQICSCCSQTTCLVFALMVARSRLKLSIWVSCRENVFLIQNVESKTFLWGEQTQFEWLLRSIREPRVLFSALLCLVFAPRPLGFTS